jgi:hypothetical protein
MPQYTLAEFNSIMFGKFEYQLPDNVNNIILKLKEEVNSYIGSAQTETVSVTYEKPFKKSGSHYSHKKSGRPHTKQVTDEDWEAVRNPVPFKATVIDKKEGIEKSINDIRICLNKISTKNYQSQLETIIENIQDILLENENKIEDMKTIVKAIFDIASNNKFFSELYADLYKALGDKYSEFNLIIDDFIFQYKENVKEIAYVDPNADYDKFCNYNKTNDRRKALSAFIVNLMKKQIITKNVLLDIVLYLQGLVTTYIDEPNRLNEVEEITENLFIMIPNIKAECSGLDDWHAILANVTECSKLKAKDKVSLSSRAIFKYMDMVDKLNK